MGYRIELGEIETAVASIDTMVSQACIYDDINKQIVMFYEGKQMTTDEIVNILKEKVPNYMIPNITIYMDQLPHNQNGKIDRKELKERYMRGEYK